MRTENKRMKDYLEQNGIKAMPKYLWSGSLRGCWRLANTKTNWWGNDELISQLHSLGFIDYNDEPLSNYSGNGGVFHIFARNPQLNSFLQEA